MKENLILKARQYCQFKHKGQVDDDGKPYYEHPFKVAEILRHVTLDEDVICAAFLHDTIEDTSTTHDELVAEFNPRIADLVDEVTHRGVKDGYGYYFPKLKSKEGIMLKLADRLSNIARMDSWSEDRKAQYLKKTRFWKDGQDACCLDNL